MRRIRVAFALFDDAVAMIRLRTLRENPAATEEEIAKRIDAWLLDRPGAEHRDCASE